MKKFYTNGVKTIKIEVGEPIPEGFHPGRTFNSNPWNKGKTVKDDYRIKLNGQRTRSTRLEKGNYKSWNTGLSKETNKSLLQVSEKVSAARKGKPSWNKGVPASSDQKLKQSIKMKELAKNRTSEQIAAQLEKSSITKLKNNSFKTSKEEDKYYNQLLLLYDPSDIVRQYRDPRYPFNCDFYIKSEDLFIELNMSWTHGPHPFDNSNQEDLNTLAIWQEKSLSSNYYKNAIKTWTERDIIKLKYLKENKLNFILLYPKNIKICN